MFHTLYFDGGCIDNGLPGARGGAGYLIYEHSTPTPSKEKCVAKGQVYIGKTTNNEAEYTGLESGMERAMKLGVTDLTCIGDSQLVIKQVNGDYRVKAENLKPFWNRVIEKKKKFKTVKFMHVLREHNKEADREADSAIKAGKTTESK